MAVTITRKALHKAEGMSNMEVGLSPTGIMAMTVDRTKPFLGLAPMPGSVMVASPFEDEPARVEVPVVAEDPVPVHGLFDALEKWAGMVKKDTLMLIHKAHGNAFQVLSYDKVTRAIKLADSSNKKLVKAIISEREAGIYTPLWRI